MYAGIVPWTRGQALIRDRDKGDWRLRPSGISVWPYGDAYTMFLDETGSSEMKSICRKIREWKSTGSLPLEIPHGERYFAVTGVAIARKDFPLIRSGVVELKEKYWSRGLCAYEDGQHKRVCFHSYEIRHRRGPFSEDAIDHGSFISDLGKMMQSLRATVFCAVIDKCELALRYADPAHPYSLAMDFMLERYAGFFLGRQNVSGNMILEARGRKEDRRLLKHIVNKLDNGTDYVSAEKLTCISGVYFNPKWTMGDSGSESYFGLELADLIAYPVCKYCRTGDSDKAFDIIEPKLYGYPNYAGRGLKRFPQRGNRA